MENTSALSVETPSGKDVAYENFPVGSWLLPANLRAHVSIFYRFARAIDDIADNPDLTFDRKITRLEGFAFALKEGHDPIGTYSTSMRMRKSLQQTGVPTQHCLDLIDAFKQDAIKSRYKNWDELMDYCIRSAAPVGRYLLDLHGGSAPLGYAASDALCKALQVINHLQDCKDDYLTLGRVYLPQDWMEAEGMMVEALSSDCMTPPVRRVIDRTILATEGLMDQAWKLPHYLTSRRLAMESTAILRIAERLIIRLRNNDLLGPRVKLTKFEYLWGFMQGALPVALGMLPRGRPM